MVPSLSIEYSIPNTPLFRGGMDRIVNEEMRDAVEAGINLARNEIVPLTPVDQGILRQGVQVSVTGNAADLTGRVFDLAPHALSVEDGSRPHWPPRGPLELWVRRKLGVPESEAASVAFLVARKISKVGTRARYFFRDGWQRAEPQIRARFDEALLRIKRRITGEA